jgi:hypothetical protein
MIPKYAEEKEQMPKKGWFCEHCGRALPKYGKVWLWRYQRYLNKVKRLCDGLHSGYFCDPCADARESGADF